MKKGIFIAVLMCLASVTSHAVERSGRIAENVVIATGDSVTFVRSTVGAALAVQISTGSVGRAHLVCKNAGSFIVYVGSGTGITSAGPSSFIMGESTTSWNQFETYNAGPVFAIGTTGAVGSAPIYCQEDR